jgi:hypothetical protein
MVRYFLREVREADLSPTIRSGIASPGSMPPIGKWKLAWNGCAPNRYLRHSLAGSPPDPAAKVTQTPRR